MKKLLLVIPLMVLLTGCDERYRYPCQNPENWENKYCQKPYCSANGTCLEGVIENVERASKQTARETEVAIRDIRSDVKATTKEIEAANKAQDREINQRMQTLQREVDNKIKKALDNPLAEK